MEPGHELGSSEMRGRRAAPPSGIRPMSNKALRLAAGTRPAEGRDQVVERGNRDAGSADEPVRAGLRGRHSLPLWLAWTGLDGKSRPSTRPELSRNQDRVFSSDSLPKYLEIQTLADCARGSARLEHMTQLAFWKGVFEGSLERAW